ncbi:HD family phosphohydrolase [Christensenella intestinihominis]|uniref:HD family phosphohydrolase n=1 Tax=Christensenella intestinihominis TaxID=1851429 RepID=UPI0008375078|nr:HDIG domain-containing metalloprotein [Christensenella intestinihominis]
MVVKETFRKKAMMNLLMAVGSLGICVAIALFSLMPQTYDITSGEISDITITAPTDVTDEVATQRIIEEEQAKIGPVYNTDANTTQQIVKKISEDFTAFEKARGAAEDIYNADQKKKQQETDQKITEAEQANAANPTQPVPVPTAYAVVPFDAKKTEWETLLTEDNVNTLKDLVPEYITTAQLYHIVGMTPAQLTDMKDSITNHVQDVLYTGVRADDIDSAKTNVIGAVTEQGDMTAEDKELVSSVVTNDLYPNMVFDEKATQQKRDEVAALVTPVEYKKGQNIVRKGELVTDDQYEVLKSMGMLTSESTSIKPYAAVTIYIVLMFVMYAVFLAVFNRKLLLDTKKIAILAILTAAAYGITSVSQLVAIHLLPVFLFVILGAVLLSPKNAIVYSVFLSLLLMSVTTGGQNLFSTTSLMLLLIMLTGGFFAVYILKDMRYRSRLVLAGLVAAIPGVVISLLVWMLQVPLLSDQTHNVQQMLSAMAMVAGSGVLCGIVSIGVLPLIENAFNLTTPTKLLELSDPTHPLTKRLMIEAPGTYHHSILVANLAEAGCNAVGGFSLLARVGAYFHDIGKVEHPLYFKENQRNNVNMHDTLLPKQSAEIIRHHVPAGVELLRKYKMPREIIEIVRNHHGSGTVGYFYAEALEKDPHVKKEDFQYEGRPPETKEQAIVMLADVVEAAVRSLDNPSREEISAMVHKLIKARYDEGQLDNAPLNRRDLKQIAEAFINIFDGVYHQRIKYPEIKIHGAEDDDNVL